MSFKYNRFWNKEERLHNQKQEQGFAERLKQEELQNNGWEDSIEISNEK